MEVSAACADREGRQGDGTRDGMGRNDPAVPSTVIGGRQPRPRRSTPEVQGRPVDREGREVNGACNVPRYS